MLQFLTYAEYGILGVVRCRSWGVCVCWWRVALQHATSTHTLASRQRSQETDTCTSGRNQTHNPSKRGPTHPHLRQHSHPDRQQRISLRDFFVILYFISLIFIQFPHPLLRNASVYISSSL